MRLNTKEKERKGQRQIVVSPHYHCSLPVHRCVLDIRLPIGYEILMCHVASYYDQRLSRCKRDFARCVMYRFSANEDRQDLRDTILTS
ncbi:hypothetical protein AVEN_247675-1 [Araneus ventricosus]|uniref:Uncharacterized protein n=1 Tax=Araneus ventricosus TaxID=182803 RepID=A0A4Y2WTI5_ARAVE|nr:hypothetical protein AVEN_247675-1 [Araneus ventricosus]